MDTFFQLVISGAAIGSVYGLIALGFLVIYHTTGVVNFGQGDMLMVGGVTAMLVLSAGQPYFLALLAVVAAAAIVAMLFRKGLLDPLFKRRAPEFSLVVGTIAFGLLLQEIAALAIGDRSYGVPPVLPNDPIRVGGVAILPQTILTAVVAWLLVALVWLFFTKTLTGIALRAVGINRVAAAVSGARVSRLITIGLILAVAVTAIGGMLLAPTLGVSPRMGLELAVKGFAAAVLGGFGSVYRAMIAGLALGMLELLGSYYVSTAYAPVIAYVVLMIALFAQVSIRTGPRRASRKAVAT